MAKGILYDLRCGECGFTDEDFLTGEQYQDVKANKLKCDCGGIVQTVIRPVMTVGPMPSKPLVVGNMEKVISSNSELRAFQKAHPDIRVTTNASGEWKKLYSNSREIADRNAKKWGFDDVDDYRTRTRIDENQKRKHNGRALIPERK